MKNNSVLAFIGGALVGAAAALLFAPDSGANTRRKIRDKAQQEYEQLKKKLQKDDCADCDCGVDE